jgi:hypothetical protein
LLPKQEKWIQVCGNIYLLVKLKKILMGQQQLLFILLGIILVAIAIFLGINLFRALGIESKRNNIIGELVNLAGLAQEFYLKPTEYGGGKFKGWFILSQLMTTANGRYIATVTNDSVIVLGVGNEVVTGADSLKLKLVLAQNRIEQHH